MWNFASSCIAGRVEPGNSTLKPIHAPLECSDNETFSVMRREEQQEYPICRNLLTLLKMCPMFCKSCILGLQQVVVKFPTLPIELPLFIICPWCNLSSFRLVYRGDLKFSHKGHLLLWMAESINGDKEKSHPTFCGYHCQRVSSIKDYLITESQVNHCNLRMGQPFCYSKHSDANLYRGFPGNH